jgi:hypothetical protein
VGRRPLAGPDETIPATIRKRKCEDKSLGGKIRRHGVDLQRLAFLELVDQFGRCFIVCPAPIRKASKGHAADRWLLINGDVDVDAGAICVLWQKDG